MNKIIIILLLSFFSCLFGETSKIFMERHSGKSYDPHKNVSDSQIEDLIQAAQWAPSSHNDQPWNYIILDREKTPDAYQKALLSLKAKQQIWAQNAPILVIVITRLNELYKGNLNEWADYDTGSSAISMALQASDLGLMTHQIGGFDKEMIKHDFALPEGLKPQTIMAIGYELPNPDPEVKPRIRRPKEENFFLGEWGNAWRKN